MKLLLDLVITANSDFVKRINLRWNIRFMHIQITLEKALEN